MRVSLLVFTWILVNDLIPRQTPAQALRQHSAQIAHSQWFQSELSESPRPYVGLNRTGFNAITNYGSISDHH